MRPSRFTLLAALGLALPVSAQGTVTVGTVTLGADLAVTGVLTPGGGPLAPGPFTLRLAPTVENGAVVRLAAVADDGSTLGGPVTFERPHLDGEGWRIIAAPLATTFQSLNDDFHTQGAPGATFPFGGAHLFAWDAAGPQAQSYVAVPDFAAPMMPGQGYFFMAYGTAPGTSGPLLPTVWDVSGAEPAGPVTVPLGGGFTLLGNPYAAPLDWHAVQAAGAFAAAYAVWDPAASGTSGGYAYYSTAGVATGRAGRYIPAAQGFWAESAAGTPPTLTFDRAWKAPTGSPVYVGRGADEGAVLQLRFALTGAGLTATEPVALFLDGGADGADLYDATWQPPLSPEFAAAYFVRAEDARPLVFEGRPTSTEPPLHLALEATRPGTYTLAWPSLELAPPGPLTLVDLVTGVQTDLRAATSYTFTLDGGRPAGASENVGPPPAARSQPTAPRFEVTIGRAPTAGEADAPVTALELVSARPNPTAGPTRLAFALPEAGPVRASVVDLLGRTVAVVADGPFGAGRHEVTFDASRLPAGVYAVRLDAGGGVRVMRLTVAR